MSRQIEYQGAPTIVYQLDEQSLEKVFQEIMAEKSEDELLMPFVSTTISARAAAEIIGVTYHTVLSYAKNRILESEQRKDGKNSSVRFNLAKVLRFRRDREIKKLKRQ